MEQAEQFFSAAQAVGPATKPVLLFYGLSQAARTVAAASPSARQGEWRLGGGHGLTVGPMQGIAGVGLASLLLKDRGRGTFTGLADILNAASLPMETRLGDLWSVVPALELAPLRGMGSDAPLVVTDVDSMVLSDQRTRVRVGPLPSRLVDTGLSAGHATGDLAPVIERQRTLVAAYLDQYPKLTGWSFGAPEGNPIGAVKTSADSVDVPLVLSPTRSDKADSDEIASRTFSYQGVSYAFPRVGGCETAAHPLLLWYAILYGLSMLSRYEPKVWARLIAIDSSQDASPIEAALDEATRTLPQVILQTLHDVAA